MPTLAFSLEQCYANVQAPRAASMTTDSHTMISVLSHSFKLHEKMQFCYFPQDPHNQR